MPTTEWSLRVDESGRWHLVKRMVSTDYNALVKGGGWGPWKDIAVFVDYNRAYEVLALIFK